ncbi:transcriptional regulator [Desemzia sp. FAM 23989]|uniref:transcriptional regulator n=1 Tax=Desemzia sp. FAM 23989 TaxID=3259523 RepID=UPI003885321F
MPQVQRHEFYRVEDVMEMLNVQQTKAYSIIRKLNKELQDQGKIIVSGRVSKRYFDERMY